MTKKQVKHREFITKTLQGMDLPSFKNFEAEHLCGDGSDRDFYRVVSPSGERLLFVFPSPTNPKSLLEAGSCFAIGRHLKQNKVPVPDIFYFDKISGIIVYEDLGDTLLHDITLVPYTWSPVKKKQISEISGRLRDFENSKKHNAPKASKTAVKALISGLSGLDDIENGSMDSCVHLSPKLTTLYEKVIESLVRMQVKGAHDFDASFCWETSTYSKNLMLERESGYFLDAYCRNFRGISSFPRGIETEFSSLAERVSQEPSNYLMHRDFQSRNIMVKDGSIHIIDFQGARFGPLAYDLASLLNDPYVQLPTDARLSLLDYYIDTIKKYIFLDRDTFIKGYYHIALQRNLQILGAFSFLSKVKGKSFFKPYIQPALVDLKCKLQGPLFNEYPVLANFAEALLHT